MRYQERIYIQNENRAVRNKDILNVNMSSDLCIFKSPKFNVSGATKVQCGSVQCDLFETYTLTNILDSAVIDCFTSQSMSQTCFSSSTWNTKIYQDGIMTYSATYYTSYSITGVPTDDLFINSIKSGLNLLNLSYTATGSAFTIDKPYGGAKTLEIDSCISFGVKPISFICPIGFSATPANDACEQITITAATFTGSGPTIIVGDRYSSYCNAAPDYTLFYPNLNLISDLPVYYDGYVLKNQTGTIITAELSNPASTFWGNPFGTSGLTNSGRLNAVGLFAETEWVGFSKCLDITSGGTYYVGISADNLCKFSLNGQLVVALTGATNANFGYWNIFPITLNSGINLIELYGKNTGAESAFAAEIYSPIDFATLTGATNTGATQANVIFSTGDYVGSTWQLGETFGYSCPIGYALNTCSMPYECVKITTTGITADTCTGTCSENCTTVCQHEFPNLNITSNEVYVTGTKVKSTITFGNIGSVDGYYDLFLGAIKLNTTPIHFQTPISYPACAEYAAHDLYAALGNVDYSYGVSGTQVTIISTQALDIGKTPILGYISGNTLSATTTVMTDVSISTSIPFTFTFTSDTSSFLINNAKFKYEIYKFIPNLNVFREPSVYKSELIDSTVIGTGYTITQSVPLSGLSLDGDYLIKGYFEADACTDFLKRLGKKIDTLVYKNTDDYSIYNPELDYYFIAINGAEIPTFIDTINLNSASYAPTNLTQQVIVVDYGLEAIINNPNSNYQGPYSYERTGSTFVLSNEPVGAVIVTLNGLTLAKDVDYTLVVDILTFYGSIANGDIINIFYNRSESPSHISNDVLINSAIPSGTTNNQGNSKYYYNTTTEKYEVYTNNTPIPNSSIMVILNGLTLIDGVDYYQSTSNSNRIILNGSLMVFDVLNLIYYPLATTINGVTQANNFIAWNITNGPTSQNGYFSLEYSSDSNFSTYTVSTTVSYQTNVTLYNGIITVSGNFGDKLYYRVKNVKNYTSICGDNIRSVAYSEVVPIVIQSNGINSY